MERKRHLDSRKCEGVPSDPSVVAKKIVENDNDVYICKECNTETRNKSNVSKYLKVCKVNSLSANPRKWSNTTETIRRQSGGELCECV